MPSIQRFRISAAEVGPKRCHQKTDTSVRVVGSEFSEANSAVSTWARDSGRSYFQRTGSEHWRNTRPAASADPRSRAAGATGISIPRTCCNGSTFRSALDLPLNVVQNAEGTLVQRQARFICTFRLAALMIDGK